MATTSALTHIIQQWQSGNKQAESEPVPIRLFATA